MIEYDISNRERLKDELIFTENQYEEHLREITLGDTLFHDHHLNNVILNSHYDPSQVVALHMEFMEEKKAGNMGDRFSLALSDKYLGKIHVVELGVTTNPGVSGGIDGLKAEYRNHLKWMKDHGIVDDELSREESGRTLLARRPVREALAEQYAVLVRSRPLIRTKIEHEGVRVKISIGKRMVFALPRSTAIALKSRSEREGLSDAEVLKFLEENFLDNGTGGVVPIRTAYIMATDVLED